MKDELRRMVSEWQEQAYMAKTLGLQRNSKCLLAQAKILETNADQLQTILEAKDNQPIDLGDELPYFLRDQAS